WPTCGCYEGGRLWLAGAINNRFDASNSNEIFNFAPTGPDGTVSDSNAISFTLNSQGVNQIRWMQADAQGILCGTQLQEWLIFATTLNSPLTPTTTDARPVTKIGCAAIPPARAEHTLVFVQKKLRKLVEYFADVFSGKFTAPDLTEKCRHLTVGQLAEVKYQQELVPTLWMRNADGSWFGEVYRRDTLMTSQGPTFIGAHRHTLGSSRTVTSISVGASEGGNLEALTMVTQDFATGYYYVEVLGDIFEETDLITGTRNSFLDAGVTPTNYSVSGSQLTIDGLWYHVGRTVQAVVGGLDAGQVVTTTTNGVTTIVTTDFVVNASGQIVIPLDDGTGTSASRLLTTTYVNNFTTCPITVGFTYNSDMQLLRPVAPAETGSRDGTALGKKKKHARVSALLNNTQGLYWGTSLAQYGNAGLRLMNLKTPGGKTYALNTLFSGVFKDAIEDIWSYDSQICFRVFRPYPATIVAVEGEIDSEK